jgi:hypothetical protein
VKPLALKLGAAAAAAVAGVVGIVLVATSGRPRGAGEHAALLEPIGKAYAKDYGFEFTQVDTAVAATVNAANRNEWAQKVGNALAIGYDPITKPYRAIPLERFADAAKIRMSRDRTPRQVVEERVVAGHTIVEVTWRFGSAPPVKSYTILSDGGQPLFDTLLSMPVVQGPAFERPHF